MSYFIGFFFFVVLFLFFISEFLISHDSGALGVIFVCDDVSKGLSGSYT